MSRVEIIFTAEVIERTKQQRIKNGQGFNAGEGEDEYRGPIFETARLRVHNGVAEVRPDGQGDVYYFPLHTIGRIKESN